MIELNLTTQNKQEELIKQYLEANASETLADKINNGVRIEKDGKIFISKKTLSGFMSYACQEAKKQAVKGANSACVEDTVVYGWAIHYFEEDSIEGTLYNEDGTEYKPKAPAKPAVRKVASKAETAKQEQQMSFFDLIGDTTTETETEEDTDDIENNATSDEFEDDMDIAEAEDADEKETPHPAAETKISPLYEKYLHFVNKSPNAIVAMRVGDFYEIFDDAAITVAEKLELTLTSRDVGLVERVPMVGFPYHKEDVYRERIRAFANLNMVDNNDMRCFLQINDGKPEMHINTETGEVTEVPAGTNDLISLLFGILKDEMEVR